MIGNFGDTHKNNKRQKHMRKQTIAMALSAALLLPVMAASVTAQDYEAKPWPDTAPRKEGEGQGPFKRLIIRDVTVIRGDGAYASGPQTIVIEGNKITSVSGWSRVETQPGDKEIDGKGMYALPGMIDTHVRVLVPEYADLPPEYVMKLLLAHGVTTIASMQDYSQTDWAIRQKEMSDANEIVAPRIQVWTDTPYGDLKDVLKSIRSAHKRGAVGMGEGSVYGQPAEYSIAAIKEAKKLGMRVNWHMDNSNCNNFNALDAAKVGLDAMTHWYCLLETLQEDNTAFEFHDDYNHGDTYDRFANQGTLWRQVAVPWSDHWSNVLDQFLELDFTFEPTYTVYEANRDYMRATGADWNDCYVHPILEKTWVPSTENLFAYFYDWSSTIEIDWRENFRLWMQFVNEYKNRGGRIVAGTDAGFIWNSYGFGLVRNLEMFQEAGFSPLDALKTATINSAEHLGIDDQVGTLEAGKYADIILMDHNPLKNLKALYGTGFLSLQEDNTIKRVGGIKYTIKDGIIYDVKELLTDVEELVEKAKPSDTASKCAAPAKGF